MHARMDTKQKRLECREAALNAAKERGATVTEHPEADCISVVLKCSERRHELTIYDGTAYKPSVCCAFSSEERVRVTLERHLQQRAERIARKTDERGNRKPSGVAQTAAAIRKTLAERFPGVKFRVVSGTFSMGNSVTISWTDGPITDLVDYYTGRYQYGRFDVYNDYAYEVSIDPALNCPGARFIQVDRTMSDERRAEIISAATAAYGCELPRDEYGEFNACRYEAAHPELWREEYRRISDEQRFEIKRAQAVPEPVNAIAEPVNVIDMSEYRQRRDSISLAEFAERYAT